jgi:hypothetical protein
MVAWVLHWARRNVQSLWGRISPFEARESTRGGMFEAARNEGFISSEK